MPFAKVAKGVTISAFKTEWFPTRGRNVSIMVTLASAGAATFALEASFDKTNVENFIVVEDSDTTQAKTGTSSITLNSNVTKTYVKANPAFYPYYRINVSSNTGTLDVSIGGDAAGPV